MMENLLSTTSDLIDTASISSQSERTSPVNLPEFDGETVLCRVCGDRASGFHYGVHACEGCKGFFRRSIQQKIQYRPCLKNQQCNIQRVNRNRCQYCRLKKCISVGMSRDAVRFGRVPKKEKARIIEQMQKKNLASQTSELNTLLANDFDVVAAVVTSHRQTCDISQFRAHQMRDLALHNQEYVNCPANMACPLNNEIGMDANANNHNVSDFSESFTPAIKSVVDFAKGIPGFILLNQDDQVTLLKAGTFEVLLVRLACLFDPNSNTMMFTGGKLYKRQPNTMTTNAGFLLDSMFDFAERFNKMCLIDDEIALFSAVVLMSPDRPGLRNMDQVERIQNKLTEALQNIINANHKEDGTLFAKLLMKTTDLRTLNTLHSEKSIAGQRASNDRRDRMTGDDNMDVDFQESISTRSGRSSPTLSEASNMTMTSGYSGDTDSSNVVVGQRLPLEASSHQQVVLRTPYGTFFREEMSGFYGMMADQPRRRCNTLDRDTLTRPRLHTIEEGNRRRYTLDRDYINKMVNRLNDRLDSRGSLRGDSVPPSISNSATSSPIQEEGNNLYPPGHTPHTAGFTPITASDGTPCTRASPHISTEALLAARAAGSSPGSPKSRSRSGSFTQEDYVNSRPRCYSFHLNSEGRAARMSLQHRMMAERGATGEDHDQISPEAGQYLSPEMRRGSVGAAYGLHSRKQSLLVDRPLSYINRPGLEADKRAAPHGHPAMKHLLPEPSMYGLQLNPELAAQRPALWHQQAAIAMGMAPPMPMPLMQRSREEIARSNDSRVREWEAAKTLTRELPREVHQQDMSRAAVMKKCPMTSAVGGPSATAPSSTQGLPRDDMSANANPYKMRAQDKPELKPERDDRTAASSLTMPSALAPPPQPASSVILPPTVPKVTLSSTEPAAMSKPASDIITTGVRAALNGLTNDHASTAPSAEVISEVKPGSDNGSPVQEDMSVETFGHKKFDRFRKDKSQPEATTGAMDGQKVKEEKMEEDDMKDEIHDLESKVKVGEFKIEQRGVSSPASSHSSCPSPNGDRPKLSAKEAHPNLLAHLMNGGSGKGKSSTSSSPASCSPLSTSPQQHHASAASIGASPSFPWSMSSPSMPQPLASPPNRPVPVQSGRQMSAEAANFSSHSISSATSVITNTASSDGKSGSNNSKEDFHAAAVSHLKDKLLRKYDSMENLAKIGQKDTGMETDSASQHSMLAASTPSLSMLNNGLTSSVTSSSSTADLNKELATKLTISPATLISSTITQSSLAGGVKPLTKPDHHEGNNINSSSPQPSPRPPQSSNPSPSTSSPCVTPSHFLPHQHHPTAAMSQMLLSQGLMHPSTLPMYHSMRQHYPNLMAAAAAAASQQGSNPLTPHLANMQQQFAQMISRTPAMQAGLEKQDRRMDFGSPLNLTSRMDDGSSSPSHSPQTPA